MGGRIVNEATGESTYTAPGLGAAGASDSPVLVTGRDGAYTVRDFLTRNGIAFTDEGGPGSVEVSVQGKQALVKPSLRQLAAAVGCHIDPDRDVYDLVIVGAGPAGLAAAVYGAAEGLSTLAIEELAIGGQAGTSSLIENYPGFPDGVGGSELADLTHRQAQRLGAEVVLVRSVVDGGMSEGGGRYVRMENGHDIRAGAVVVATGVDWRRLQAPGLAELDDLGVFYGAATSQAPDLDGADVMIVGGGNSAGQAAMFFSRWANRVTIVIRGHALSATLSAYLLDRIQATPNIEVLTHQEVAAVHGSAWLETVDLVDNRDGSTSTRASHSLFLCIGGVARTRWAVDSGIACDSSGYLLTGDDVGNQGQPGCWPLERTPDPLETSWPLMYAVGDVRHGSTKRITTAMGDGALVVKAVQERLIIERAVG